MRYIGRIKERNWYGEDGMEHLRTIREPAQPIPTFAETVTLLMKVGSQQLLRPLSPCIAYNPAILIARKLTRHV